MLCSETHTSHQLSDELLKCERAHFKQRGSADIHPQVSSGLCGYPRRDRRELTRQRCDSPIEGVDAGRGVNAEQIDIDELPSWNANAKDAHDIEVPGSRVLHYCQTVDGHFLKCMPYLAPVGAIRSQ